MNDNETDLKQAIQQFSVKFHKATNFEDKNFVASPLGVWLLLSQIAGTNSNELSEDAEKTLEDLLGLPIEAAYDYSNELMRHAPEVIKIANAAWLNDKIVYSAIEKTWIENLREADVATVSNILPNQKEIDVWTKEKTLNIIDSFPMTITGNEMLILANVLATRITWADPFEEIVNDISNWEVPTLLFAHKDIPQKIVEDTLTGEKYAVVHNHGQKLHVYSVIAVNPELDPAQVLEVAEHIMASSDRIATVSPDTLEDNNIWTVSDFESYSGDEYVAHLPAWEAETKVDVVEDLNFPVKEASEAVSGTNHNNEVAMVQVAKAKFNKKGFEAAAVTAFSMMKSSLPRLANRKRVIIRFNHNYAVVANYRNVSRQVTTEEKIWNDIPVFSAWITEASEVTDDDFS